MRLTGWPLEYIDDVPAQRLDWLLAMDGASAEAAERIAEAKMAEALANR